MTITEDELLRTEDVAAIIRKPVGTLRQWRHRSFGPPSFRLGGTVIYRKSELLRWIAEQERNNAAGR